MEKFNQLRYNQVIDICQKKGGGGCYGQTGEKEKNMFVLDSFISHQGTVRPSEIANLIFL